MPIIPKRLFGFAFCPRFEILTKEIILSRTIKNLQIYHQFYNMIRNCQLCIIMVFCIRAMQKKRFLCYTKIANF